MKIYLADQNATQQLGINLGRHLAPGTTILLEGDLGAGKTTLVQGLATGLDIDEPIVSPTFTLISEYDQGRIPLYHLDLYRLQPKEVEGLYLETYWEGTEYPPGIMAVEWAERLPYLPPSYLKIHLTYSETEGRWVEIDCYDCDLNIQQLLIPSN